MDSGEKPIPKLFSFYSDTLRQLSILAAARELSQTEYLREMIDVAFVTWKQGQPRAKKERLSD
jgi:hypothetical protein